MENKLLESERESIFMVKFVSGHTCHVSELAVGCSTGVLVWTIDPSSVVARPSAGCVSLLQSPGKQIENRL